MSPKHDGFKDFVLDQLHDLPHVTCRAMFGGFGLYQGRRFFGIIHKGHLYFKVDAETMSRYKALGMRPFRPNPKQTLSTYYEVPVDIIENQEGLAQWAREAIGSEPVRKLSGPAKNPS